MPRLGLSPPRAVLAGSPLDHRRAWWEPWARIQGSQDNVRVVRPEYKALFSHRKFLEVPDPFDGSERGQSTVLANRNFSSTESGGSKGPL